MSSDREREREMWARTLMNTREQLIEAMLHAQRRDTNPSRPVFADEPRTRSHQHAHALVLEMYDQVRPELSERELEEIVLATIELPDSRETNGGGMSIMPGKRRGPRSSAGRKHEVTWRPVKVSGLSSLDQWRYRTLPRAKEAPGRTRVTTGFEDARALMPPVLLSGARSAIDQAIFGEDAPDGGFGYDDILDD